MTRLDDLDDETREIVVKIATATATVGVPRDTLGEPTASDLDTDPIVFSWPDGTELSVPQEALAANVAIVRGRRAARRRNLN